MRGDALSAEEARHLLSATMHDNYTNSTFDSARYFRCEPLAGFKRIQERAADFDEELQSSPSVSASPSIRFMF